MVELADKRKQNYFRHIQKLIVAVESDYIPTTEKQEDEKLFQTDDSSECVL